MFYYSYRVITSADEDLVTPPEAHLALGGGRRAEAALDEGARAQVELAHDGGVGAAWLGLGLGLGLGLASLGLG